VCTENLVRIDRAMESRNVTRQWSRCSFFFCDCWCCHPSRSPSLRQRMPRSGSRWPFCNARCAGHSVSSYAASAW